MLGSKALFDQLLSELVLLDGLLKLLHFFKVGAHSMQRHNLEVELARVLLIQLSLQSRVQSVSVHRLLDQLALLRRVLNRFRSVLHARFKFVQEGLGIRYV
jgi:hypothetical protein